MEQTLSIHSFSALPPLQDGVAIYAQKLNATLRSRGITVYEPNAFFWKLYPFRKRYTPSVLNRIEHRFTFYLNNLYLPPKRKTSIYHFHATGSTSGQIVLRYFSTIPHPKIITLHEQFMVPNRKDPYNEADRVRIIQMSDALIVHSKELHNLVAPINPNTYLIKLATNAHDLRKNNQSEVKKRLGLEGPCVLQLGFLAPHKGLEIFIEAASKRPDITYIIAGDGMLKNKLKEKAQKMGINVRFTGFLSDADYIAYLEAADVVAFPRIHSNGECSAVLVDAMALGKTIVASNIGCFKEYLAEERGILVEPNNASLLAAGLKNAFDEKISQKCSANARHYAQAELSFNKVVEDHIRIYKKLLEK